jgi:hypothetical protein
LQGEQYVRGKQTERLGPYEGVSVLMFGARLTVAHQKPPAQSVSVVQPKTVQNALASVGDVP